jgi:hypothetical protein
MCPISRNRYMYIRNWLQVHQCKIITSCQHWIEHYLFKFIELLLRLFLITIFSWKMKKYFECLEISSQMYYSYCLVLRTISNIFIIIHVYTAKFYLLHRSQVTVGIRQTHISMSLWHYLVKSVRSSLRHSPSLFQLFFLRTFGFLVPRDF